uniref:Alkaline ceramidase n=1 Tax=Arcella intermedia TaxID=1963864 RepID=A0A6B2LDN6_9EUKA
MAVYGVYGSICTPKKVPNKPNQYQQIHWAIWFYLFLGLTGIASAIYHATLHLYSHLFDEISESWAVLSIMYSLIEANLTLPTQNSTKKTLLIRTAGFLHGTIMSFLIININGFCEIHLFLLGISIILLVRNKTNQWKSEFGQKATKTNALVHSWLTNSLTYILVAFMLWTVDRVFCDTMSGLIVNPQFHAWWHILCAVGLYMAIQVALHCFDFNSKHSLAFSSPLPQILFAF